MLSAESTTKAWQLRDRVSDREKFFIDFPYDRQMTGNLEKAYQTLELWLQTYPRGGNQTLRVWWAAFPLTGQADLRAIEAPKKQSRPIPTLSSRTAVLRQLFVPDRFEEAESALQRATERKLEDPDLLVIRYNIAVLKGDKEPDGSSSGSGQGQRRSGTPDGSRGGSRAGSFRPADTGPPVIQPRHGSGPARGGREVAASYQAARAVWEAVCGNAAEGKRNATAALALSNGRDVEYAAGLALALSGDSSRSQPLADDLEKRFPEDTSPNLLTYRFFARYRHSSTGSRQTAWSGCTSLCPMSWR